MVPDSACRCDPVAREYVLNRGFGMNRARWGPCSETRPPEACANYIGRVARPFVVGAALAGVAGVTLLARGALTLDLGIGRRLRSLGPLSWEIGAPPDVVFDVIASPYLGRTPLALQHKLEVWERGSDMVVAAHFTRVWRMVATTVETIRFERPRAVHFRLIRGPVPHVVESFELRAVESGTELTWEGELGTDLWQLGSWWGSRVAQIWTETVRSSLESVKAEAERRAG